MHIRHFNNEEEFTKKSSQVIFQIIQKNNFRIALSGGNTPKAIYQNLAEKINDAEEKGFNFRGDFYQVDERYIPATNEDSNQKMILETGIPLNMVFKTTLSLPKCIEEYDKKLPEAPFSLCVLGIGPDGHTASIFPNTSAISSTQKVVHTTTNVFPVKDRLTLTFKSIMDSDQILVLLKNKREVLSELKNPKLDETQFPAHKLLSHPRLVIHSLE